MMDTSHTPHKSCKMSLPLRLLLLLSLLAGPALAQSNYAQQGNSVEYDGNSGLPDQATLNGRVTKLDDLSPVIFLNRTKAVLNCEAGSMKAELKFNEPFFGIVYADFDRNSACQVAGKGALSYRIELPLKGCGTRQDPQRVFTNNIVVRFHPGLEMDGDEVITIVCRYPPPIAQPPAAFPAKIVDAPVIPLEPPLQGFQILLIICAILFLSLLLLGLGCSYYCLRTRNIQVVRRAPFLADTESESSKLSNPSLGPVSLFEGLKIPRAHTAVSLSSSEQHLVSEPSDTLPSDYPSESPSSAHSEVEEVDTRSLRRPSTVSSGSYEPHHKMEVQMRVKRSPPPPSPPGSDFESQLTLQQDKLTTILEQREDTPSIHKTTFSYVPELHAAPAGGSSSSANAPVYSRIMRRQQVVRAAPPPPRPSLSTLTTETADFRTIVDTEELTSTQRVAARPPPPPIVEEVIEQLEAPVVAERRPEITSHVVDDVFLRTITEKKTIEDIERHRRQVKEFHAKPPPPNPKWDVVIRNYPAPGQEALAEPATDWESYSETSSASGYPTTPVLERPLEKHITDRRVNVSEQLQQRSEMHRSSVDVERTYRSSMTIPPPEPPPPNWDVLIRVLDQPEMPEPRDHDDLSVSEVGEEPMTITTTATTTALTQEDREKWRQILTTESSLRTLLTEATVKEDYERIRSDERYERLFEPAKWDVIIRVLAPPERLYDPKGGPANGQRYRRKTDWDTRSRRSSLPTLYEYDSDGTSSLTMTTEGHEAIRDLARSRRTSRSSMPSMSDMDVRSMTEVMVDYTRPERADTLSDASGPSSLYYRGGAPRRYSDDEDAIEDDYGTLGLARSLSQPSLARSASEFTEHWAVVRGPPSPTSPRSSARSTRSSRGRGPAPLPPGHQAAGTTTTTTALVHPPQGHHNVQSYSVQSESQQGATRTQTRSSGYVAQRGWFSEQ
ncbi:uncharacterized protein LOC113213713 isoform X2 [Frankliniella occidentalis]|uniref:Uncharacterized protein LOC113213713 isoform X2 n=1 Tax=Frankliniella occidentalis TaxID=133901 RepID=A0A6J1TAD1_FRAOC|nr:uncharacterized protein LOC113213713 isoform X2 [Frankliniella occidentalis]